MLLLVIWVSGVLLGEGIFAFLVLCVGSLPQSGAVPVREKSKLTTKSLADILISARQDGTLTHVTFSTSP
jgi:hypothetical protein